MGLLAVLDVAQATVKALVTNSRMLDAMQVFPCHPFSAVNARERATGLDLLELSDAAV